MSEISTAIEILRKKKKANETINMKTKPAIFVT